MCFRCSFETIFNITDLVQQVVDTVNDIATTISGIDIESLTNLAQINVTSVLNFIFNF